MLALIGMGLDAGDISVRALAFLKTARTIYIDRYTSIIGQDAVDFIRKETGREVTAITRSDMEEKVGKTIASAKDHDVAILVIGDPLVATTHHIILDEAARLGINAKVFHSSSIFSAGIGESGLDIYKFGPTTTVPFWSEHYKPTSFMDVIAKNLANKEHTLLLLDLNQPKGTAPMSISQAAEIIGNSNSAVLEQSKKIIILADIGRKSQEILYVELSKITSLSKKLEGKTLSLIIPSSMSFAEEEAVRKFSA